MTAPSSTKRLPYAVEQRRRFVDFLLVEYGHVNRSALVDWFGVSMPQASRDIGDYLKAAPGNAVYDASVRSYFSAEGFKRLYP